ncbi:MAG: DPP IV N-terminal domain-containing protein [Planctomycetota bacterium]
MAQRSNPRTIRLSALCILIVASSLIGCAAKQKGLTATEDRVPAALASRNDGTTPAEQLTFEQARGRGRVSLWKSDLPTYRWAADGKHIVEGGRERRWLDPRSGTPVAAIATPEPPAATPTEAQVRAALKQELGDEFPQGRRWTRTLRRASGVAVVQIAGKLFLFRNGSATRVGTGAEEGAQLSPDGRWLAFVRDHNVFTVPTQGGTEVAVTTDGHAGLLNGRLDWVYQEEIYGRGTWDAIWWSPSSAACAFLRLEQSNVPTFPIVDHRPFRVAAETMHYPKAGDPNPRVSLGVWNPGKVVTWVDLTSYDDEILIVSVGWNPAGDRIVFQVQDRAQTWLDLNYADPESGKVTRLLREESLTWVNGLGDPMWLDDGSFLWFSERTGYKHVYHYAADGVLQRPVTQGDWAVRRILRIDEPAAETNTEGRIWFTSNRESAVGNHAYRIDLSGEQLVHLTPGRGTHSVEINEAGTLLLDRYSHLEQPPRCRVLDLNGDVVHELGAASGVTDPPLVKKTLHQIAARDGFLLDVTLTLPVDFSPSKRYPIWLPTYSGPNSPRIRDRWSPNTWYQFLTQQGIVVLEVNNRSSSGRGQIATAACYRQLGVSELADIEDAVRWVLRNDWADPRRVGITGGSYGGFMAAYALTHSDLFALGVAWAGVYDWRCYDTIYTERYMDTPQNNRGGYERTSVTAAAARLKGHLVMGHGSMDDNVHMQNVLQFAEALQRAGKQFDLMIYPGARHGIRDRDQRAHWNLLKWHAIRDHLLPPKPAAQGTRL